MPGSPAVTDVDLLTVLEHELGHVLGLADNNQPGDLMDIALGLGVRRSPTALDLATIAQDSGPAVAASGAGVVSNGTPSPVPTSGSFSQATVDAALASMMGPTVESGNTPAPVVNAGRISLVDGAGKTKGKDRRRQATLPFSRRLLSSLFLHKDRSMGQSSVVDPKTPWNEHGR